MRLAALTLFAALLVFCAVNPNQLLPAEVSEGWILLYDGESAFGWSLEGAAQWATDPDGDLSSKAGESGDMVFNTVFGDYQLTCEIKGSTIKGSGPVLNGVSLPPPKPGDRWHLYTVNSAGGKITASLDGKKVLEQNGTPAGTIVLHYRKGDSVSYRSIRLRPAGLAPIFNGKDLAGWRADSGKSAQWSVKDASIHVEQGPGQLETEALYKDFVLQLDIRANSPKPRQHPDSGVFFRGDAGVLGSGYESQIHNEFEEENRSKPVNFGTGGIFNFQPARRVVPNDNEFFSKTIVARGRHIAVWVNGIPVTDFDDNGDHPRLNAGPVSLQAFDRSSNLDFKNLRISELKP